MVLMTKIDHTMVTDISFYGNYDNTMVTGASFYGNDDHTIVTMVAPWCNNGILYSPWLHLQFLCA